MPRWEVTLIGKKGHRYGTIEARDEREATAKAAESSDPARTAVQDRYHQACRQKVAPPKRSYQNICIES